MATDIQNTVTLDLLKRPELPADYQTFKQAAQSLEVNDDASCGEATRMIERQSAWDIAVEKCFAKASKAAYDAWKSIVARGGPEEEPGLIAQFKAPMSVRGILEPRIKVFLAKKAEAKRLADLKIQRENEAKEHAAREAAAKIQREADAEAARLRDAGQMRLAKETQQQGTAKAVEVVFAAAQLAEIGTVLPDVRPAGGPGESRPWQAEVTDLKAMCAAIGRGEIPLIYEMPKRGGGSEMVPLVIANMALLNYLAKRMGRADIGIAGARGIRELSLKFSRSAPVPVQSGISEDGGW